MFTVKSLGDSQISDIIYHRALQYPLEWKKIPNSETTNLKLISLDFEFPQREKIIPEVLVNENWMEL